MLAEQTNVINLTPAAAQAVRDLLEERNLQGYALRVFVAGGGCSGLQYGMALEEKIRKEDITCEFEDIKVVVDEVSVTYLQGATVDYVNGPSGSGFKIDNPNQLPVSGCGSANSDSNSSCGCSGCS